MPNLAQSSLTPLIRLGAWGAMLGGGLRVIASFVPYVPHSAGLEALYGVIDIGLLFGLIAIYLDGAAKAGRAGLAGFAIGLIGMASIVGPDAPAFGIDFYLAGSLILLIGLSILATASWRAGHQVGPAAAWLLSAALAVAGGALSIPLLGTIAGVLFGIGFVVAGWRISS